MRVLTLASEFPPAHGYGLGRYVSEHSAALVAQGCEVSVACNNWDANLKSGTYQWAGVEVNNAPMFIPVHGYTWVADVLQANLLLEARAVEMARRSSKRFDLIQVHDWLTASAARSLRDLLKLPLVVMMHDTVRGRNQGQLSDEEEYIAQMEGWICEHADAVLCNSAFIRNELIEAYGVDDKKLTTVGCGINPIAFEADTPPRLFKSVLGPPDAPLIAFVGRLTSIKGPHVLLEAVPHVLKIRPDARFIFAGDGKMRQALEGRAQELQVEQNVRFVGHLRGKVLATLYHCADVTVVPSLYEPFGMVALEAMACHTPVIVSETGGLKEIVADRDCALLAPPNDAVTLARAILYLLNHPQRAAQLADNGCHVACEQYGWEEVARRTKHVYEQVVA